MADGTKPPSKRCTICQSREMSTAAFLMGMDLCWVCYRLNVSAVAEHEFQKRANGWDKLTAED